MEELFRKEQFDIVVDATHPYASVVTENICAACAAAKIEDLRLNRNGEVVPEDAVFAEDLSTAVHYLNSTEGNILLTTGSKELNQYAKIRDFAARVYARVLPMEESLQLCESAGLKPAHILAMQGPFSREMNVAMLKSVSAKFLVTKDSGNKGGFEEKITAAREAGAKLVVETIPMIEQGSLTPEKQEDSLSCYAKMLQKSLGRIDWNKDAVTLERLIRGLNSWPGSYTKFRNKNLKIWEAECGASEDENAVPGEVIAVTRESIEVQTGEGSLLLKSVQPEGKKRMAVKDFLLGYPVKAGERFGE